MARWFKRRSERSRPTTQTERDAVLFAGQTPLEVVGESHYQEHLRRAVEAFGREVPAVLMPEPENEHDSCAVAVLVGGLKVGYLSRADAPHYHDAVAREMQSSGKLVAVEATIVGGEDTKPSFGIWLSHDPVEMGVAEPSTESHAERGLASRGAPSEPLLDVHGQPYEERFNRARRAERQISELLGMCRGFLADGELSEAEVRALHAWFERGGDGAEDWVVAQIVRRVRAIAEDGVVTREERSDLQEILSALVGGTSELVLGEDPRSTGLPLDDPAPELQWSGSVFVFTGKFAFGPRADCERVTVSLGGIAERDITKRTDYLVIGTFGSRDWVHTAYGRKIQKATHYREKGLPLAVVCEDHWRKWL